jgi:hypothetical protein
MRHLALCLLLSLAPLSAHAWPPAEKGEYAPAPGSNAEHWMLEQVLHKMRHKRAMLDALHWIRSEPELKTEFAEVSDTEAAEDSDIHDLTKLHQEKRFLKEHGLPMQPVIPEVFGKLTHDHVKPAPEGTKPKDPKHPTPAETFRIWIDKLNASDDKIEETSRAKYPKAKQEKLACLALAADFADTGIMRRKEFGSTVMPSAFVTDKMAHHWARLEEAGPFKPVILTLLKRFEHETRPGVSLYQDLMKGMDEDTMLPILKEKSDAGTLKLPQGLEKPDARK